MSLFSPPEWHFTSTHPSRRTAATENELRIHEKLHRGCLHSSWKRMQSADGDRKAICDTCGSSVYLGSAGTEWDKPDPDLTDHEVRDLFLKLIPLVRYDEVIANRVVREIEAAGWHCLIHSRDNQYVCTMSKGSERFESFARDTKPEAITETAGKLLCGKWPR